MPNIIESAHAPERKGSKWRVRLISEGQGSSGYYPAETLRTYGVKAWPKGTHIYFDHLTESEDWERRGSHSIRDLIGVTTEDPVFEDTDGGLYTNIQFIDEHKDFIEQVAEHVGLSVEAGGEIIEGRIVSISESPLNAVALVPRAGRDGKLIALTESYRESGIIETMISAADNSVAETPERNPMTEEDIKALVEALVPATVSAIVEALKPAEPEKPEEDAVDEAAVVESAVEAGLSKTSRARVIEAVRSGKSADEAIASEKTLRDELLAEAKSAAEASGFVISESGSKTADFSVKGW